jgi:trimeric autotransporter adhesin
MKKWSFGFMAVFLFLGHKGFAQKMTVKDSDAYVLMEVNDEGKVGSITLPSGAAPSTTTNKLYNQDGSLYWNGAALAAGGSAWNLTGNSGTTPGVNFIGTTDDQALEFKVNGHRVLRLESGSGDGNVLGGYHGNTITAGAFGSVISGGGGIYLSNNITDSRCTIGGGCANMAGNNSGSINDVVNATVGGGENNWAGASGATVGGGWGNLANGGNSTVPGGAYNRARGNSSFAAGTRASANHDGSFVWSDHSSPDDTISSTSENQFVVKATGGVHIQSGYGILLDAADRPIITRKWDIFTTGANTNVGRWGMFMEPGTLVMGIPNIATRCFQVAKYDEDGTRTGLATVDQSGNMTIAGTLNESSDRNRKENIESVSGEDVLRKLSGMPVSMWSYKEDGGIRHIGPMAQDFRSAFGLGQDETHIAAVDAGGVALAAIQGLYRELQNKNVEIADLRTRLEALEMK